MNNLKNACESCPALTRALEQIYSDGDLIRTMLLLTDLTSIGCQEGIVQKADHFNLSLLQHLLGELVLYKLAHNP